LVWSDAFATSAKSGANTNRMELKQVSNFRM
jgi:hypothetical protein